MTVVSNTGPIIALSRIEPLFILPALYQTILIPHAVRNELTAREAPGAAQLRSAEWLHHHRVDSTTIVGFGEAVRIGVKQMNADNKKYHEWTEQIYESLHESIDGVERNGHPTERLAHNLNVYIPGIESRALIVDLKETAVATGSACTSADVEPSHVITAMHDAQRAHSSIRISLGRGNDAEEVKEATKRISEAAESLRAFAL